MLGAMPFLVVVFGTPFAVLAVIPAVLVWNRLYRGRGRALSALYLPAAGASAIGPRLWDARRAAVASLAVALVGGLIFVALAFSDADPRLIAVAGPITAAIALLVLLVCPLRRPLDAAARPGFVPLSRPERRWMALPGVVAGLLGAVVVAAGVVSVPDLPSPHYRAYPQASVVEWWYSFDGFPKDIEYTLHGVTAPWPGWWYGTGILAATAALLAVVLAVLLRVHRLPAAGPAAGEADDAVRMLLGTLAVALASGGLLTCLAFVLTMIGDVLTAVSLFPKPKLAEYGMLKPFGHTQPLYAIGLVAQWSWAVLGLLTLAAAWVGVFVARELAAGAGAVRRVLGAGADTAPRRRGRVASAA